MELNKEVIGDRIKEARKKARLSQPALASKVIMRNGKQMKATNLYFIETGKSDISFNYMYQIAKALDKQVTYFL